MRHRCESFARGEPDDDARTVVMDERNLLADALRQQQEHALILLDRDACIVEWLPSAAKTLGYVADEMRGQTLERLFTPEDVARGDLDWEVRSASAYGRAENDRWQVRKDGVRIWVSGALTALKDADGELQGFVKILRDRTDLRTHIETLQARLNQATKAEEEKHMLFGTLAHELRNPLGSLRNAVQLIRMASSDRPQVGEYVAIIERQIRFVDDLLRDLLESARLGVGKAKLNFSRFAVRAVIDSAVETCSDALRERSQRVEVLLPEILDLIADEVRLRQVLVNLIGNSSKFSPDGSTIWVKATVDANEMVLRVEDHGKGIPSEMLPRIFELFTQAEGEGNDSGHGLGLGLGLVKSIVEMHGGTVQARSEGAGKGAEVIVRLPLTPLP
jgi:two-component system CheB/CheR fusion protein